MIKIISRKKQHKHGNKCGEAIAVTKNIILVLEISEERNKSEAAKQQNVIQENIGRFYFMERKWKFIFKTIRNFNKR